MRPSCRRAVALILAPAIIAGCRSWRAAEVEPHALVETQQPSRIRVTTLDGSRVEIIEPRVTDDSIQGRQNGRDARTVEVAVADVTRIETRRLNVATTAVAILVAGVLVTGLVLFNGCESAGYSYNCK